MSVHQIEHRSPSPVCSCGSCKSCTMRRYWSEGRFAGKRRSIRPDAWSRDEYELLERLAGTMEIERIAERISEQSRIPRTANAVKVKIQRRGLSRWVRGMSLMEIERLFGLDHRPIIKHWVTPGLLVGRRWSGRGPNAGWWFEPSDVEAFIRRYPWAYDWKQMQPRHRLTSLAEMVNRADPWLTYEELGHFVGLSSSNLDKWRRRGLIPFQRRPKGGPDGYIMVRARDLRSIKANIEAARAANCSAGTLRSIETRREKARRARGGEI